MSLDINDGELTITFGRTCWGLPEPQALPDGDRRLWGRTRTGESRHIEAPPIKVGDLVVVSGADRGSAESVSAYDAATGRPLWKPVPIGFGGTPAVERGAVYLRGDHGQVIAVDALDGSVEWESEPDLLGSRDPDIMSAGGIGYAVNDSWILAYR